ncbi:MAG: amino acid ABC transporter substrate-binding protein [Hyphomicrobiaceae bacterium]|nr:amino acid ABC transporter substrate-binding protein [Hyphomicrobiaceae bacterium]
MRGALHWAIALSLTWLASAPDGQAGVLETVRARDHLVCGVGDGPKGYSTVNAAGVWSGISVDFCRAVAAAVLGDKDAVKFRPVQKAERFSALQSGEIDVLSRDLAITASRDTGFGIRFPGVLVFDGQGFMVRKAQGVASALELSGTRICVLSDGPDAQGIADYFGALRMPFELSKFDKWHDAVAAYTNKSCQVLSANVSRLSLERQHVADPSEQVILPEIAARHLVGPAVRQGDEVWFGVVRWTLYALVAAEELGINSSNVDAMKSSPSAEVRSFLGVDTDTGRRLDLTADWTQRLVRQVGNYGEIFERHLGQKSPLKLERRLNNLAVNGGLHYAPPFR